MFTEIQPEDQTFSFGHFFHRKDLPGGFFDPGEGALECLYRELQKEIGWTPFKKITLIPSASIFDREKIVFIPKTLPLTMFIFSLYNQQNEHWLNWC